jgi:hypothetical protein
MPSHSFFILLAVVKLCSDFKERLFYREPAIHEGQYEPKMENVVGNIKTPMPEFPPPFTYTRDGLCKPEIFKEGGEPIHTSDTKPLGKDDLLPPPPPPPLVIDPSKLGSHCKRKKESSKLYQSKPYKKPIIWQKIRKMFGRD